MSQLNPADLFARLSRDLPAELHEHLLVVGSLAAAYAFRAQLQNRGVNTKDADLVVHPAGDTRSCAAMAERLRDLRWKQHPGYPAAASNERPDELPAIRLYPPDSADYFVEFLSLPEVGQVEAKKWIPVQVHGGWFGLPTFRFQGLTEHGRLRSEQGIHYATPAMMALANLLSHPVIGRERMSGLIGNRRILRSAKDLGRVLALAHLSTRDEVEQWLEPWERALMACFPADWRDLAGRAGAGLRRLLEDASVLEEAHYTCEIGLLNSRGVTPENLRLTGRQLLADLLDPLAAAARQ